jgi:hypothetical protein
MNKMLQRLAQEQHGTGPADHLQAVLSSFPCRFGRAEFFFSANSKHTYNRVCFVKLKMIWIFA